MLSITPAKVAAYGTEHGYVDEENNTYWRFMDEAGANWNLNSTAGLLSEEQVALELSQGHPIICSVGPGDFTKIGHFIVLTGYENGNVKVNDPFSIKNSESNMGICQYQRPDKSDVGIFKKIAIRRQAPVEDRFRETGEKDMRYDFTKIIDRHGKDAIAVDGLGKNPGFAPEPPKDGFDVIPMWVADMNFETVPTIPKAIMDRAAHPGIWIFQSGGRVL